MLDASEQARLLVALRERQLEMGLGAVVISHDRGRRPVLQQRKGRPPEDVAPAITTAHMRERHRTRRRVICRIIVVRLWRSRPRLLVALFVAVALGWVLFASASLVLARRDFSAGEEAVNRARGQLTPTKLKGGSAERQLRTAASAFHRGRQRVRQPLLLPIRVMPFAGRQLGATARLAAAGAELSTIGAKAAGEAGQILGQPIRSGSDRLAALERLSTVADRTERAVAGVALGPSRKLLRPVADARVHLAREVAEARARLQRTTTATRGIARLLRGPRSYLVLAGNNAEMRAGSGMFLSAGLLTVTNGELSLGEMRSTTSLQLAGAGVPVEGDQAAIWGWTNPGREWRSLGMTPRFETTAPLAARMWEAKTGVRVDGVFALDVVALRSLLAATGPVGADGVQIGEKNVERYLLHDQYRDIAYDESLEATQATRRDRLSDIARAALQAAQGDHVDLGVLGARLADAAAGRHLLLWSSRVEEQAAWEAADVSGKLAANSLLLALLNRGGNKLDQFVRVDATIQSHDASDGSHDVTVRMRIRNSTPGGEPPYVAGPHPDLDVAEGTYVGLLALTVPGEAQLLAFGSGVMANLTSADGPTRVIVTELRLARGEERAIVSTFRLPRRQSALVVEPSARVPTVRWHVGVKRWHDGGRRTVALHGGKATVAMRSSPTAL